MKTASTRVLKRGFHAVVSDGVVKISFRRRQMLGACMNDSWLVEGS